MANLTNQNKKILILRKGDKDKIDAQKNKSVKTPEQKKPVGLLISMTKRKGKLPNS